MLVSFPPETRTLIENVRWETYVALSDDRRGNVPMITYDQGLMELMSPKKEHEKIKTLLGRLVAAYAEAIGIEIDSVASTTFRREDLGRGFEADESYYIAHAVAMRAKDEIDLNVDPPPELVIEVEMTSSAICKLELFARLGIGRFGGTTAITYDCIISVTTVTKRSAPALSYQDFLSRKLKPLCRTVTPKVKLR